MSESEQFHRFAVEAGRIGTWDLDLQTGECLVSPKMAELMGLSREQTTVPARNGGSRSFPKIEP
jgi:PAS domain-containing protein